ncbi:hypothetical protein [Microcoleus sp.]|uniref:hypothetical protein n=1 Tax=Microcoleus sp. TaxID=44472 RepID=UPI003524C8EE
MSDQPENNQILTQHPETIATLESSSPSAETPPETSVDAHSLITDSYPAETPPETSLDAHSLTTDSHPAETPPETSLDAHSLITDSYPAETPPETSLDAHSLIIDSHPAETPPETSLDAHSLIIDSHPATTPPETSLDEEHSLTTNSQPAETPRETSLDEHSLTTDSAPLDFSRETMIAANISNTNNDPPVTVNPAITEDILHTKISSENSAENAIKEDILMANLETETETIPMDADIAPPTIDYDNYPTQLNPTPNPEPKKTGVWQVLAVFLSGMLVGSVLSLGALLAWRMYQERVNLQIKLPADVPLRPSPSPLPATPANRLPAIPPAPATPQSPVSSIPSPTPTLTPTLSGVPQLASPSPSASTSPSPSVSPSPAVQTAVTERVSFEPGAIGVTLRNTLPDNKSKRYLLECNSGQSMTLKVEEGKVSATIIAPNGEKVGTANSTSPWQGQLPSSGDYTIELSGDNKANYGVKIEVK